MYGICIPFTNICTHFPAKLTLMCTGRERERETGGERERDWTVFGSGIRDPRSGIRDPRSGIPDPGSGMGQNQDPGSGINIPDPQHCIYLKIKVLTDKKRDEFW